MFRNIFKVIVWKFLFFGIFLLVYVFVILRRLFVIVISVILKIVL